MSKRARPGPLGAATLSANPHCRRRPFLLPADQVPLQGLVARFAHPASMEHRHVQTPASASRDTVALSDGRPRRGLGCKRGGPSGTRVCREGVGGAMEPAAVGDLVLSPDSVPGVDTPQLTRTPTHLTAPARIVATHGHSRLCPLPALEHGMPPATWPLAQLVCL